MPTTLPLERAPIGQLDADAIRAVDDVVVGEDVAVGGDDDAGAEPACARRGCGPCGPKRRPKNSRNIGSSGSCIPVGVDAAFFSTRTVTTAGEAALTTLAYDPGVAASRAGRVAGPATTYGAADADAGVALALADAVAGGADQRQDGDAGARPGQLTTRRNVEHDGSISLCARNLRASLRMNQSRPEHGSTG